jgi:thiamine pyrophosphokinase
LQPNILPGGGYFVFMPRLIIFANGTIPDLELARRVLRSNDVLCAADGGTRHALALGLSLSCVVGDLDSLAPDDRRKLEAGNVDVRQYPRDKDMTDLELAIHHGVEAGFREIFILGGLGGRIDQSLGNLSLLTGQEFGALDIRMDDGVEQAFFTRDRGELHGRPGDIVSLIPWGGAVTGITTAGLRWRLRGETLFPNRTRGISNEMSGKTASIRLKSGLLLIIHQRLR